ncbi:MAG: YbgA family protein [Planctomycetota bacterium]|jgi:uncharacterized protein YbgA (DUF1722 family)/uncharacterized protein YbbK (DUF523 family)
MSEVFGDSKKIRIGISSCLLGENVRYNGGHQLDRFLRDTLGAFVEYVPVCPEVEAGYSTPREPFRLVGDPVSPRLLTTNTREDHTDPMRTWSKKRVGELETEELCGFIFKARSPSSGMERVKVYNEKGMPIKKGVGIFARAFMERFPLLPVEEDGRLHDPVLRENFIVRIFALGRWRDVVEQRKTRGNLVAFHTRHKLLILSHSPKHYTELGRMVARAKSIAPSELYIGYQALFLEALKLRATVKKHVNVLHHVQGFFKKDLASDEKQELREVIERYGKGLVPLIVPITLLNHFVRKYDHPYLKEQWYLNPHPVELKLRNHA